LEGPFNKNNVHTSNGAFSPDSNAFYFTRCKKSEKVGKVICAIYRSEKKNGKWEEPKKLGPDINKPEFTSTHPSLGTYERGGREYTVLYFSSNQEGTRGGMDIFYAIQSYRTAEFRSARNLGRKINTEQDEITPYYDRETETLYFSSQGHVGMGGFDIYKTEGFGRRWEDPTNLGYPINSSVDDIYYILRNQRNGYLVSNRPGTIALKSETCCDDIWSFHYKEILNLAVTGFVYDEDDTTETPLTNAVVTLYSLQEVDEDTATSEQYEEILLGTDSTRKEDSTYFFSLKEDRKYQLSAVKDGYLVGKKTVSTMGKEESDTMEVNIPIKKIQKQESFIIKNIYYDFDKATLKSESKPGLDTLVMFLEDNPQLIVEISAHTDSVGSDAYNRRLSQRRAESVVDYLTDQGIDTARLKAKGYGESDPIAPNTKPDGSDNPEGRAQNRRTEFKILGELEDVKLKYQQDILYNIEGEGAGTKAPEPKSPESPEGKQEDKAN
jgi:outer membrane protein OmpA-like peptidoglycan-associated protein